jgi:hypothetical protein
VAILNKVMQYVQANESTKKLKIVNVIKDGEDNELLKKDLEVLDRAYPEIDIEFIEIEGVFGPDLIEELSVKWHIPKTLCSLLLQVIVLAIGLLNWEVLDLLCKNK